MSILTNRLLVTLAAVSIYSGSNAGPTDMHPTARTVELTGRQIHACEVALAEFHSRNLELGRYSVIVKEHPNEIEVVFVPDQEAGGFPTDGGKTIYGPEIHYFVTKDGLLNRIKYAR